ncbi:MAG TPA: hypothetical protein VFC78_07410 [Tepidisphaeraceae bacterium]|nr:hypothetical protein [Tepidisphaeraceae bacterium]
MLSFLSSGVRYGDESFWLSRLIPIGAFAALILIPALVIRSRRKFRRGSTARWYDGVSGIRPPGVSLPGDVRLVFHTYSGFLVYFDQVRHDVVLPAQEARVVLGRMLRHNLTVGLLSWGGVFALVFSWMEYRRESKKIANALRRGFPIEPGGSR